jgi:hypothetical protein
VGICGWVARDEVLFWSCELKMDRTACLSRRIGKQGRGMWRFTFSSVEAVGVIGRGLAAEAGGRLRVGAHSVYLEDCDDI